MQKFLDQATHNEKLLIFLDKESPEDFFDWKITILFYTALQLLKAFQAYKKVSFQNTHRDRFENINPNNANAKLPLNEESYDSYSDLYNSCANCRYDGFLNSDSNMKALRKYNHILAVKAFNTIKAYLKKQGLPI